jgi:hypothetical protein
MGFSPKQFFRAEARGFWAEVKPRSEGQGNAFYVPPGWDYSVKEFTPVH